MEKSWFLGSRSGIEHTGTFIGIRALLKVLRTRGSSRSLERDVIEFASPSAMSMEHFELGKLKHINDAEA